MINRIGYRLFYNDNGEIINGYFVEMSSMDIDLAKYRPEIVQFIDLPFGYNENNFKNAIEYHIDITKDKNLTELRDLIVIDKYREKHETEEEKLRREKEELENQLLLKENKDLGGIL